MTSRVLAVFILGCVGSVSVLGNSITVGVNNVGNAFPFGGPFAGNPGTQYQEAYSSSLFSGPISITGIDFFLATAGTLYAGTYTFSFSSVTSDVNSLSNINLNSNLGSNNQVFDVVTIAPGTTAPSTLTFTGTPFTYNPGSGNLLLNIQIANPSAGTAYFEDGGGSGPSTISRDQNFGTGTSGFGLVTQFDFTSTAAVPETRDFDDAQLRFGWRCRLARTPGLSTFHSPAFFNRELRIRLCRGNFLPDGCSRIRTPCAFRAWRSAQFLAVLDARIG